MLKEKIKSSRNRKKPNRRNQHKFKSQRQGDSPDTPIK